MKTSVDSPLVSVCVPNLNTLPYLQERVDTILAQTYSNWEMIVSDNFSDDGAWEFFEKLARQDDRVSISQAPRQGLYANWNNCIHRARGKYVYIATSDDTMAPDCIEKLVSALEKHPDCDLAHCPLIFIDSNGNSVTYPRWPECTVFGHGTQGLLNRMHVRRAPYDGLLHLSGEMVYLSITALLIRRSLFSRIGGFESRWGSLGDRNWDMKASLVGSTVHIPDTWASWRVHPHQATASAIFSTEYAQKVEEMIHDAFIRCESYLMPEVRIGLKNHWLDWTRNMRAYHAGLRLRQNVFQRRLFQASQVFSGQKAAFSELSGQLRGRSKWPDRASSDIRNWLESLGLNPLLLSECQEQMQEAIA